MRIFEGIPFAFERHWKRLERDANRIHCPFSFKAESVREQLGEVLRANHVKEGCARIYAIYNQAGFWRSGEEFPPADLIIYSSDLPAYSQSRAAWRARTGAACRVAIGGSEGDVVVDECVEPARGAARGIR